MRDVTHSRASSTAQPACSPPPCHRARARGGRSEPRHSRHRQQQLPEAGPAPPSPGPASPPHRGANPPLSWVRNSGPDPKLLLTNQTIKTHSCSQEISLHQLLIYGVTGVSGLKAAKSHQRAAPTRRWALENNHKHASEEAAWDAIP